MLEALIFNKQVNLVIVSEYDVIDMQWQIYSHQLSRPGIEPGSIIPVEPQILSTEPQQLTRNIQCFTIIYVYFEIGSLQTYQISLFESEAQMQRMRCHKTELVRLVLISFPKNTINSSFHKIQLVFNVVLVTFLKSNTSLLAVSKSFLVVVVYQHCSYIIIQNTLSVFYKFLKLKNFRTFFFVTTQSKSTKLLSALNLILAYA